MQCFQYDWLGRLTAAFTAYSATGAGPYNHTYAYDAIGNLTSYAGNSYTYGGGKPHAVTAAFGNSYGYDANGNQTSRTISGVTYTFTFDYENRLTAISGGSVSATFVYDADGNRVKGTVGGVTTVYVAGLYEYQGGATTHYYEGNALRRTGYGSNNGVFYLLQDHLKSSSAVINQNGTLNAQHYYFPYGGNRGSAFSTLTTKRFTGQYHEAGLPGGEGLSYYNARWYDARLGRFLSADTLVPNPANPQAFNRYSYVFNNPLNFIDPTGYLPISDTQFLFDDGGSTTNGGGSSRPFVQYSVSYQGLFGTTRGTYRFYTDSTWNRHNITTGMRLLWDVSFFSAPSRDLDYAYGAWQAWGQQNVQRLPEPLRTVARGLEQPGIQDALLATIRIPASNQLFARAAGGTGRAYNKLAGQGVYVLVEPGTGVVRYVGRGDAPSRILDHARHPRFRYLDSKIVANNNLSYAEARGLEQLLIDQFGGIGGGQLYNRNRGIARYNPFGSSYLKAAEPLLQDALEIIKSQ